MSKVPWQYRARDALYKSSKSCRSPTQTTEEALNWDLDVVKRLRELDGFVKGLRILGDIVDYIHVHPEATRADILWFAEEHIKQTQERVAREGII